MNRNSVIIEANSNTVLIEPHLNSVILEVVPIETIVHFLSADQPVHVDREVQA